MIKMIWRGGSLSHKMTKIKYNNFSLFKNALDLAPLLSEDTKSSDSEFL